MKELSTRKGRISFCKPKALRSLRWFGRSEQSANAHEKNTKILVSFIFFSLKYTFCEQVLCSYRVQYFKNE